MTFKQRVCPDVDAVLLNGAEAVGRLVPYWRVMGCKGMYNCILRLTKHVNDPRFIFSPLGTGERTNQRDPCSQGHAVVQS